MDHSIHLHEAPKVAETGPSITELSISGMNCGNCVRHVTQAIQTVPGVFSAVVSLDSHAALVHWAPDVEPDIPAVIRVVEAAGYGAKILDAVARPESRAEHKLAGWTLNLWIGLLGTLPLMIGEWVFGLGMTPWFWWSSFVIAGVVQVFAGAPFYRGAWAQLKAGASNMDTLVALGSTTAFGYSAWSLLAGRQEHLYFMEAASIIALVSLGHWMESRMTVRASSALRELLNLAPPVARKLMPARGEEIEVPVAELKLGDRVVLRPGDRVPTDGAVTEGESAVDESMLTGESMPVDKSVSGRVYAGSTNLDGRLLMRVTATGRETALAHIIAAVQRAQSSRANIQRLGDRVSSVFVPSVVVVAILAGLWWGLAPDQAQRVAAWLGHYLWPAHPPSGTLAAAFLTAAAVLIVACPCAMGLATPAAIMAGSNAAARRGILIRDGVALEKAGKITGIIFDKTGTLTAGKPAVAAVWEKAHNGSISPNATRPEQASPGGSEGPAFRSPASDFRLLAAALARHSTHPISQAIAGAASAEIEIRDWKEVRGAGVQAEYRTDTGEWKRVRLGSLNWLRECGINPAAGEPFIAGWSAQGATLVGLARESELTALFALKDTIKPAAPRVVQQLQRQGFKVYLVTGDNALTAAGIARQIGIPSERVHAEVRPEQKADFLKHLQESGERVAFVGDGINDAPALEQSDLGIAVSRASDVAREAADIVLLNSELESVPESLGLARATLRTIKQNLFWAFFYNALGVPLAALGLMSPILCAAAMGFSDMIVIGNALRLRHWRSPGA